MSENAELIAKWLEAGRNGFTQEQIEAQFKKVQDPFHWKNDIYADVSTDGMDVAEFAKLTKTAIRWFCGDGAIAFYPSETSGNLLVVADGYWTNGMDG